MRIGLERDGKSQRAGALLEHVEVREAHQFAGQRVARQRETEFRADTGRLARGQRDAGKLTT